MKTSASLPIICLLLLLYPVCLNAALVTSPTDEGEVTIGSKYRSLCQGEVVKIYLQSPVPVSATLSLDGKDYTFISDRNNLKYFVLIALGLDMKPETYNAVIHLESSRGVKKDIPFKLAVSGKTFPSKKIKVAGRCTSLAPAAMERIKNEKGILGHIYSISTPGWLGDGRFIMPLSGSISGAFGERRVFNRGFMSRHRGIDIRSPKGTSIRASNSGKVVLSGDLYFSGNTVIINHGIGLFSIYCHMSKTIVWKDVFVDKGEVIGYTGSTGRSTGPHLHWGLRLADTYADPLSIMYLPFD